MEHGATTRVIPGLDAPDADEAVVGFGIATAVRDAAILAGIGLGLLYLFPVLGLAISPEWRRHPQQIAPVGAVLKLRAGVGLSTLPISPWAGLGVLAASAAIAPLIAATIWLVHRKAAPS